MIKKRYHHHNTIFNTLVIGSSTILLLLGLVLLNPSLTMSGEVKATGADYSPSSHDSITTQVNATVRPNISIAAPSSFNLELMPDDASEFASSAGRIAVSTNNASGFRLLIESQNSDALTSRDNASSEVISSIRNESTGSNFANNTWGYYLGTKAVDDTTYYHPVSTIAQEALKTDVSSTDTGSTNYYTLAFGAKVDNTLPAGTYSNNVVISAVANPLEVHSLMDLTFMQDMTTSICAETPSAYNTATGTTDSTSQYYANPVTKQLIDTRDGKKYWVAKLADGNCWMTQNLALNLGTAPDKETEERLGKFVARLTPADSDVVADYVPESSTNEVALDGDAISSSVSNQFSWSWGNVVFATPLRKSACQYYTEGSGGSAKTSDNLGEICASSGFVDVSDVGWKDTYETQNGSYQPSDGVAYAGLVSVNLEERLYDAHYLVGNYYQFNTVTAGSGASVGNYTDAPVSICPKGWKIPTATRSKDSLPTVDSDYYKLLLPYGYPQADQYRVDTYGNAYASYLSDYKVIAPPFYFPLSGYVGSTVGYLRSLGLNGRYVSSSTAVSFVSSIQVLVDTIFVTDAQTKTYGYTTRCIAE